MGRKLLLLVLLCADLSVLLPAQTKGASDIAVVVNPQTPIENMGLAEVRQVFRGDKQFWSGNLPVVLLIRAPVARERDVVLKVIFQMSETQFKQYWVAKIFRAEAASAPKIVYSNQMQAQLVTAVPGAIAFMEANEIPQGVRVVKVNGLLPGQSGYPLR